MRIGVPKEIKNHEYRVGLTPAGAHVLAAAGHEVWIETRARAPPGPAAGGHPPPRAPAAAPPAGAHVLAAAGHEVWIETRAGAAVGLDDAAYRAAGAQVAATAAEIYAADLVIKVKELQPAEF